MDDEFDFTEDEIQEQLEQLGYYNVPRDRLRDFKKDLEDLIKYEKSRNSSWSTVESSCQSKDEDVYSFQPHAEVNGHYKPRDYHNSEYGHIPHHGVPNDNNHNKQTRQLDIHIPKSSHGPSIHIERGPGFHNNNTEETRPKEIDTSLDTTTSTERRIMKRKVLRKVGGKSQVFDESSVTESDFDEVEERLKALPLSRNELERPKTAPSGERRRIGWATQQSAETSKDSTRPNTAEVPCYRLPEDYLGAKALIRPMTTHPHTKNIKKTDPVSRYQQYRQSWSSQKAPGEKNHKSLRWNVREQMLYHDQVVEKKPQKVFVPNSYKVPTDKKRKNLRWHIRMDLAQGLVPPSMYD